MAEIGSEIALGVVAVGRLTAEIAQLQLVMLAHVVRATGLVEIRDGERAISRLEHERAACGAGDRVMAAGGSPAAVEEAGGRAADDGVGEFRTEDVRNIVQSVVIDIPTCRPGPEINGHARGRVAEI